MALRRTGSGTHYHRSQLIKYVKCVKETSRITHSKLKKNLRFGVGFLDPNSTGSRAATLSKWFARFLVLRAGRKYKLKSTPIQNKHFTLNRGCLTFEKAVKGTFTHVAIMRNAKCIRQLKLLSKVSSFQALPLQHQVAVIHFVTTLRGSAVAKQTLLYFREASHPSILHMPVAVAQALSTLHSATMVPWTPRRRRCADLSHLHCGQALREVCYVGYELQGALTAGGKVLAAAVAVAAVCCCCCCCC